MALTHYVQTGADGSLATKAACGEVADALLHDVNIAKGVQWCPACAEHLRALEQDWSSYESQCF